MLGKLDINIVQSFIADKILARHEDVIVEVHHIHHSFRVSGSQQLQEFGDSLLDNLFPVYVDLRLPVAELSSVVTPMFTPIFTDNVGVAETY